MAEKNEVYERYLSISGKLESNPEMMEQFTGLFQEGKTYFMAVMTGQEVDKEELNKKFNEVNLLLDDKFGESFKEWDVDFVLKEIMRGLMSSFS